MVRIYRSKVDRKGSSGNPSKNFETFLVFTVLRHSFTVFKPDERMLVDGDAFCGLQTGLKPEGWSPQIEHVPLSTCHTQVIPRHSKHADHEAMCGTDGSSMASSPRAK
jgi:hypothetical protein